jgi:hypothetical protein
MTTREDGGPAHPTNETNYKLHYSGSGLSVRDYFAAKAMHAELTTASLSDANCEALIEAAAKAGMTIEQRIAFNSYELADAMLAAREAS